MVKGIMLAQFESRLPNAIDSGAVLGCNIALCHVENNGNCGVMASLHECKLKIQKYLETKVKVFVGVL